VSRLVEDGDERLRVVALEGTFAATRLKETARVALDVEDELDRVLGPTPEGEPRTLRLTDPLGTTTSSNGELVLVVQPESSAVALVRVLVLERLRATAAGAASSDLVVDGITGIVAAELEVGPSIEDVNATLRDDAGQQVSIFVDGPRRPAVATSFASYLIETAGADAFRSFITAYDPTRPDQAAELSFHQPLGALEEDWLPTLTPRKQGSPLRSFTRQIIPLLRPHWKRQLEVGIYQLFGLAYGLLIPLSGKYLIDTVIVGGRLSLLWTFIVVLGAIYVFNGLIQARGAYVLGWLNLRVLMELQERMFAHLQRLSHDFYSRAKVGDIMSRLTNDLQIVQQAMTTIANTGIALALTALAAAIALFILNPLLAAVVLIVVPLFVVSFLSLQKRFRRASFERQRLSGETTTFVQENLSAQTLVKAFGMEQRATGTFRARLQSLFDASLKLVVVGSMFQTTMSLATTLGQMAVFGLGGYLVMTGRLTLGSMLAFLSLVPNLFQPLAELSGIGQQIEVASGSIERINELLNEPVAITDKEGATDLAPVEGEIRFESVSFGYGGPRPIIENLDLIIPAGTHLAIVGPSGSGKSTIVNLVMRFWDPASGRVLIDGHDLRDVTVDSLRAQIGYVAQETFIFDTTVRDNIRLARPDASDEEINEIARATVLDGYIAGLPAGFDTVLGERGARMSGGQRQRLAIARALLREPRLLILDEATSALDAHTEQEIVETLVDLVKGRTTLTITHRLALAARADRIVSIANGRVVEQGTHEELLAAGGLYKRLHDEQAGGIVGAQAPVLQIVRLREVPLFKDLDVETLNVVAQRLTSERFSPGDEVVRQGEPGDRFYVIAAGSADVIVDDGLGPQQVGTLRSGDFFGELALLKGEQRKATVRAAEPLELYGLDRADFALLMEHEKAVRATVEMQASRRAVPPG
jgi:ATP-binding cassette subfamily B protein